MRPHHLEVFEQQFHPLVGLEALGLGALGEVLPVRGERLARTSLDEAAFTKRVAEGRRLDDAAADRLALGPPEGVASPADESGTRA